MSKLELKSKSTHELWVDEEYAEEKFAKTKWVPLEDAQRIERKLDTDTNALASQLTRMTNLNIELSKMIDEANKIIDNYYTKTFCSREVADELIHPLRKCLSNNSPVPNKKSKTLYSQTV